MKHFFELLEPTNIAAKNGLSIYIIPCLYRALWKDLHSFRFPHSNFARIRENLLVSKLLDVNELA